MPSCRLVPSGYVVRDLSANGVFVNGARTGDAQPLRRGDVIRIGTEEFRFYADDVAERRELPRSTASPQYLPERTAGALRRSRS